MWWSRSIVGVVLLAVSVSGCGYRPVLAISGDRGNAPQVEAQLAAIDVAYIANRTGQDLRNQMRRALATSNTSPAPTRYRLVISISESSEVFAKREDEFGSRGNLILTANFQLLKQGAEGTLPVLSGISQSVSGYDLLSGEVTLSQDKAFARKLAIKEVVADLRSRLGSFFQHTPNPIAQPISPAAPRNQDTPTDGGTAAP